MGNKTSELKSTLVPGPGSYNANNDVVKSSIPRVLFSAGTKRNSIVSKTESEKPGPGMYELSSKKSGPSYTFRSKDMPKEKKNIPGPGMYDPNPNAIKDTIKSAKISKASR